MLFEEVHSGLADTYATSRAFRLHFIRYENVLAEDIVPYNLGPNYTTRNLPCVNSDAHVEYFEVWVRSCSSNFGNYIQHVESHLHHVESFFSADGGSSTVFRD